MTPKKGNKVNENSAIHHQDGDRTQQRIWADKRREGRGKTPTNACPDRQAAWVKRGTTKNRGKRVCTPVISRKKIQVNQTMPGISRAGPGKGEKRQTREGKGVENGRRMRRKEKMTISV